jgi:hypothetical protein
MNDSTRAMRRSRRTGPSPAQTAAAIIATAALALLAAACSGNPSSAGSGGSSNAGGSANSPSAVAYSACMRSHRVPNFPDPNTDGKPFQAVDPQLLGVSSSLYQAAEQACQPLLPTGGSLQQQTQQCLSFGDCPQALVQQLLTVERRYAQCLRSHGIPNWPDPTISPKGGRPVFDLSGAGLDSTSTAYSRDSSQFGSMDRACRNLVGGSVPILPYT